MSKRSPDIVDEVAQLASQAEPPGLDDSAARRLIERAMLERHVAAPAPRRTSIAWPLAVAACACLALLAWLYPRPGTPKIEEVSRVTLPTGDELIGAAGARYDLEALQPASRRIRLRAGSLVADVKHVVAGQRFEIVTQHAQVIATGTVFSVTTDALRTTVHVFEGHVEVVTRESHEELTAGQSWPRAGGGQLPPAIIAAGDAAAATRPAVAVIAAAPAPADAREVPADEPATADVPEPARHVAAAPSTHVDREPPPAPPVERSDAAVAPPADTLDAARKLVVERHYQDALDVVLRVEHEGTLVAPWLVVRGDALRGLGRDKDAAGAYESAASLSTGADRIVTAYTAAYVRFNTLQDAAGALATLDRFGVDGPGSALGERGLGLRARVLVALGRGPEARAAAQRYLSEFPTGDLRSYMRSLVREPAR